MPRQARVVYDDRSSYACHRVLCKQQVAPVHFQCRRSDDTIDVFLLRRLKFVVLIDKTVVEVVKSLPDIQLRFCGAIGPVDAVKRMKAIEDGNIEAVDSGYNANA